MSGNQKDGEKGSTIIGGPRGPQPGQAPEEGADSQEPPVDEEGPQPSDPEQTSEQALPEPGAEAPAQAAEALPTKCPNCTADVPPRFKFCPRCSHPIDQSNAPGAEPAPLPAATPAPATPAPQPQPSATSAATRQATTGQQLPRPGLWQRTDMWMREYGLLCLAALICCTVALAGLTGAAYGVYWLVNKYVGDEATSVTAIAVKQPTPSVTKPKAVKPAVLVCSNYTVTPEPDGSLTTGPCECKGNNCPARVVCQGDYGVWLHKETTTYPDDTETTRVIGVEVDLSKCQKLKE